MLESYYFAMLLRLAAVAVQLSAAILALRLIRVIGKSPAWWLISSSFCIMAIRRLIMLREPLNPWEDVLALIISVVLLAGVIALPPLFLTIKHAAETLERSKEELELQVAQRTEELRDANAHLSVELDERRRAEVKLAQYATDLARSNVELEQFAYIASHDLQEPLRMVASFTQLLAKRYQGRLDQDAQEFIEFAVDGANRMQQLLHDLLVYSRVGTRGKPPAPTDLNEILAHAEANLQVAIRESGAVVTHEPLPIVAGDRVQLTQLFQNLLANAIKFRGKEAPLIHVSAQVQDGAWLIAVKDNGIGLDPQHRERIFNIFQRLHPRHAYPGTGVGLAICKKIVERHGGRIWVESTAGRGSTFYFSIPEEG